MYHGNMKKIVIIGGGAAGLAAGIAAAWKAREAGALASVRIFEADDRVGRSILATGNGRCNFSNAEVGPADYFGASFVEPALEALEQAAFWPASEGENAVLSFFEALGLAWREEGEGRLYPITGKASTVLDVLRATAFALGVQECCGMRVRAVEPPREAGKPFTLRMEDGAFQRAQAVICACGGKVARALLPSSLGFAALQPVLGPLKTDVRDIRALDNIRVRCAASVERDKQTIAVERGEVLFRKYGVSGIAIFNLSRFAQAGDEVVVDLLPDLSRMELQELLNQRAASLQALSNKTATCEDVLRGLVLPLVGEALLSCLKLKPSDLATPHNMHRASCVLKRLRLKVEGPGDVKQCQVHRGGFLCDEFDPITMECRSIPGLYAAGEMLNVDGPCGGYNLHWAWSSGLLAGISAVEQ